MAHEFLDIPALLLGKLATVFQHSRLSVTEAGMLCGMDHMRKHAEALDLTVSVCLPNGCQVHLGETVAEFSGSALNIIRAEDILLGDISKPSGIATAAAACKRADLRVVSGGWKKIPPQYKPFLHEALTVAGVGTHITDMPFVYLDKNYVRLFGSVSEAVRAAKKLVGRTVVVQLRGELEPIEVEALSSAIAGADILMVDTGQLSDLVSCRHTLQEAGMLHKVEWAFAGGVTLEQLPDIFTAGADIVDIGRTILDAPLLDFRYDIMLN